MKMPIAYEGVKCPHCGECANISFKLGGRYWLAESTWQCPHCEEFSTTAELHEAEKEMNPV